MNSQETNINFYETHYDIIGQWFLRHGDKVVLGNTSERICRFCEKKPPEASFRKVAHAIPELLGNKSIQSTYECDSCNEAFGKGIENDLGNWSKPIRTLIRIRGKSGVPTLKKGGDKPGWRIEYDQNRLNIKAYENEPIFVVDEARKNITFTLRRDAYTPLAVLKAFIKIGLTLMPEDEIDNFRGLITWIRELDHTKSYVKNCPVLYSFLPGPMPNDHLVALILRRKENIADCPYAFLVLGYGNEIFQVPLPSERHDRGTDEPISVCHFPLPNDPNPNTYGEPKRGILNLMDNKVRRGDTVAVQMRFDSWSPTELPGGDAKGDQAD